MEDGEGRGSVSGGVAGEKKMTTRLKKEKKVGTSEACEACEE